MKKHRFYFFAILALTTSLACSTISNIMATPTPVPTNTPVPSPTPLPSPTPTEEISAVLFEGTDSCITGGTDTVDRFFENGQFRMTITDPSIVAWTDCTGEEFSDFILEIDASQVGGPVNNIYGVIFRFDSVINEFYVFAISGDGYYVLALDGPNRTEPELLVDWTTSSTINLGNATNRIRVEAIGNRIAYFVNDQYLGEITDNRLSKGSAGVFVGTIDEGGLLIGYDNFKLTSP